MKPIIVSVVIKRPVEEVFAYYIDPAKRPRWSNHVLSGVWVNDKPPGVGAIFQVALQQWGRVIRTDREITEYEPNRKVCYVMDASFICVESCQTFEPHSEGTTFTIHAEMRSKGWLRLIYPFIAKGQADHLVEEAHNLKRALESSQP